MHTYDQAIQVLKDHQEWLKNAGVREDVRIGVRYSIDALEVARRAVTRNQNQLELFSPLTR